MEAVQAPIIHLDGDGTILCWNPAAEQMLQLNVHLALGTDFANLLVPFDRAASFRARLEPVLSTVGTDVEQEIQTELVDQKGRCFPAQVRLRRRHTVRGPMTLVIIRELVGGERPAPDAREEAKPARVHLAEEAGKWLPDTSPLGKGEPTSTEPSAARERMLEPPASALAAFVVIEQLTRTEAGLRAEVDRLRENQRQLGQTELELTQLRVKLLQSEEELARLKHTETELRQAEAHLRTELAQVREQGADLRQTVRDLQGERAGLRHTEAELRAELTRRRESEAQLSQTAAALGNDLGMLRRGEAQLRAELHRLREKEGHLRQTELELTQLRVKLVQSEAEVSRLLETEARLKHAEAELRAEVGPLRDSEARLKEREAQRAQAEAALRGELAGLRETADALQGEVTRLRANEARVGERESELQDTLAQLREKEARVRTALDGSEMGQQRIRRRFQDHLQLLSSLLGLKKNLIPSLEAQRACLENQQYLLALLELEGALASASPGSEIAIGEYLETLVRTLRESYGRLGVWTKVMADPVALDADRAAYLGLIVTELAMNAFKHAFPRGVRDGQIGVSLKQLEDQCELRVWDTGIGLPQVPDLERVGSPGWRFVHLLVARLQGKVGIEISKGTSFRVTFPLQPAGGHRAGRPMRRHPRFVVRRPIVCRPLGTTRYHPAAVRGELRDLSAGGAQIALPSHLNLSQQIDLVTVIDGESFRARAEVMNADLPARRDPTTGYVRHGVRWCSLDPATGGALAGILVRASATRPPADSSPGGDAASSAPPTASVQ